MEPGKEPDPPKIRDIVPEVPALKVHQPGKDFAAELSKHQKAAMVDQLKRDLGPRYYPENVALKDYQVYYPAGGQGEVLRRVKTMSAKLDKMTADGVGIIFHGSVGTGKDHLASALLYTAAGSFGIASRWVNGCEVFRMSRDAIAGERKEGELLQQLAQPTILCISDPLPPVGDLSSWNVNLLYLVINRRYHALKPTWATLNVVDGLDAENRLSLPVFERWKDRAELLPCFWPSYRKPRNQ